MRSKPLTRVYALRMLSRHVRDLPSYASDLPTYRESVPASAERATPARTHLLTSLSARKLARFAIMEESLVSTKNCWPERNALSRRALSKGEKRHIAVFQSRDRYEEKRANRDHTLRTQADKLLAVW